VVNGGLGSETGGERDGSDVLSGSAEGGEDGVNRDVEDGWGVDSAVIEDVLDVHLVLERSNLELVQESGLTGRDLLTLGDDLDGVDDFDLTLDDLGGDVQVLEEGGLLGVHTGTTSGDGHISGSDDTNLGGGLSNLRIKNLLDVSKVSVGEDHTSVQHELVLNQSEVGSNDLLCVVLVDEFLDGGSHEGLHKG
jgi:hypothetical protein